jgi:DNA adenine methylase
VESNGLSFKEQELMQHMRRSAAPKHSEPRQAAAGTSVPSDSVSVRPPLKWAGGKRWQVQHLRALWEPHQRRRLVEPFCGGFAVTLGLNPETALLNDVNPHVINLYRWLKRGLDVTVPMEHTSTAYYAARVRFNKLLKVGESGSAEAAALFYYLNRTGYNGLCRFNNQGGFNVPFGRYKKIDYRSDFSEYKPVFARFEFTNSDFAKLPLRSDDFVYADPPYDVEFTQYSKGGFGWAEQQRAAEWLSKHPGPVVLSNQWTDRIVELYKSLGFNVSPLQAPRLISCTGDRTPAKEVLATRNL